MYNFTDLIARSYLESTSKKKKNIAQFFFQEYYQVRPEANAKYIFSKTQFYIELIDKIDGFIKGAVHNYHIDKSDYEIWHYDIENDISEVEVFENFEKKKIIGSSKAYR